MAGKELRVNGRPIKLRAANYHVTYAGYGHHPPPHLVRRDIRLLVEANLNALRSWPTPPPAYTDACDELGMFTTIEAPINLMIYAPGPRKDHGDNPALAEPFLALVERMLETYRSHPSVLLWGLANESPYHDYFRQGALRIKQSDPSRPVFFGSDNRIGIGIPEMDVNDDHYPRDGHADINQPGVITGGHWDEFPQDRPIMFTEWCHIHVNNQTELELDPGIDEYWGYYAQTHNEFVFNTPGILGGYLFKAAPYRAIASRTPWRGFFDDDRRLNDLYWHVKKASSPIKLRLDEAVVNTSGNTLTIPIVNRHDFTDLSELSITWRQGGRSGRVSADAVPHDTTAVQVPLVPGSGEPVEIVFTHPRGIEVDRYVWRQDTAVEPNAASAGPAPTLDEADGRITVTAGGVHWRIDRATGRALHGG
ncbi:MAG: glycoside hydrolase family 2 TIM barrel-domain containing protein, partial [Phycisphaerales bacterium]